jgi:hypothetical protein
LGAAGCACTNARWPASTPQRPWDRSTEECETALGEAFAKGLLGYAGGKLTPLMNHPAEAKTFGP